MAGSARMRYSVYMVRQSGTTGWENSAMTILPPGLVTRSISARAFFGSLTLRRPKEMVLASKVLSANGRLVASPAMKSMSGRRRLPTFSMPREKSQATTSMPASAYGSLDVPVPAARSSTRWPGRTSMASTTTLRQRRVCPIERTSLTTSYFGATSSNIVATSSGRFSRDARFTQSLSQMFCSLRDHLPPGVVAAETGSFRHLRVVLIHHDQNAPHSDSPFGWRIDSRRAAVVSGEGRRPVLDAARSRSGRFRRGGPLYCDRPGTLPRGRHLVAPHGHRGRHHRPCRVPGYRPRGFRLVRLFQGLPSRVPPDCAGDCGGRPGRPRVAHPDKDRRRRAHRRGGPRRSAGLAGKPCREA